MAKKRIRLDQLLVERSLAESRHKAQAMIIAGEVLVDEQKVEKPGKAVDESAEVRLVGVRPRYVSRAGEKLEGAIDHFEIDIAGAVCLDIGASTGGFTDCLLQHGAARVYAIDVGTAQLDWRIRKDERVVVQENVNARYLTQVEVPEPVGFVCCDVSFISVSLILPCLPALLADNAEAVILAKPQFEVGKDDVGKGGIVRDPALHRWTVERVSGAMRAIGFSRVLETESPILGAKGNREFLLYGRDWVRPDLANE